MLGWMFWIAFGAIIVGSFVQFFSTKPEKHGIDGDWATTHVSYGDDCGGFNGGGSVDGGGCGGGGD